VAYNQSNDFVDIKKKQKIGNPPCDFRH